MNAAEAIAALSDCHPAVLLTRCPWCHGELDGHVFASFLDGKLLSLGQTKRIGRTDYTWLHCPSGCRVPALDRVTRPVKAERAL